MPEITTFAKTNFRGQERVFGIKEDDRRRHFYVVGKTGTGKTTMIENMAIQDIRQGRGVAIVDPHGEFAERAIRAIPSSRINDVIYFNPADQDYPIAFNVMEKVGAEYRHLVASGLVGVFKKIWADSWGPRLEYILRNAILGLLEYPGSTLLGVTRILVDKSYRERVVEKITDPVVKSFWVDEFTKWNDRVLQEVISPIQNKVGQFLSSSLIRNIVGQTKSAFNIRELMDEGKILIMNLSKGRIGEDNSALLGAMMITKIQLAAMARVDVPESERKDFYLYVDEFQNFATDSFANILSEARKYRLNLIIAHQYIGQLMTDTSTKVRDAVFGNVGTLCVFRVGAEDAEFLEKEFEPTFMIQDLVNLPNRSIYIKLMIDGISGNPFSASTLPPIDVSKTEVNEEKVIRITRERYGSKREIVEEKIVRWAGLVPEKDLPVQKSIPESGNIVERKNSAPRSAKSVGVRKERKPARAEETIRIKSSGENQEVIFSEGDRPASNASRSDVGRQMYAAKCANCEIDIEVPFKPDGSRPTFCKDCLRDYQRQQAKIQQAQGSRGANEQRAPAPRAERAYPRKTVTLREASKMPPRAFRRERSDRPPRKKVNLAEVRSLIKESLDSK
ncbi:MAG: type IV secretion system DNA-binding domain-containing protein [Candidatus Moranbacteria bacterium]|nr:type IV secretion system DNA-binding domain-containing protein [Candidatus Moranbacteria bacterium]